MLCSILLSILDLLLNHFNAIQSYCHLKQEGDDACIIIGKSSFFNKTKYA